MSFTLPDLVIESVIRDGLANIANNPDIMDDIFGSLLAKYNMRKYGQAELVRLKAFITGKEINVVHSFGEIGANVPCFSVQLGNDMEAKQQASLGDHHGEEQNYFDVGSDEFNETILVANQTPISYDINSGKLSFNPAVDFSEVTTNKKFVNADGEFIITGPVIKTATEKAIFLTKGQAIDIAKAGSILSQLNYTQNEINGVFSDTQILIGIHSKEALITKYMYVLLKYFLVSRKADLINRCFIASSFQGSDFTRNMEMQGDMVYTRFMTASGKIEDSWDGADVQLFDDLQVTVGVPGDEATSEDLDIENNSVVVSTTLKC
tara:strand:+ start:17248 stop:18210 length:963 start_codon:yes stop_codon:yes gene_type:complete